MTGLFIGRFRQLARATPTNQFQRSTPDAFAVCVAIASISVGEGGVRQMDQSLHRQRIDNWKPQRKLLPLFAAVVAAKNLAFVELDVSCALAAGAEENSIRCIGIELDALDHAFARTREPPRELLP